MFDRFSAYVAGMGRRGRQRSMSCRGPALAVLTVALLAAAAGTAQAQPKADVVRLANGDQITGEVKHLTRGRLELSTDDEGTVYFEWDKVVSLSAVGEFEVTTTDGRRFLGGLTVGDPKTLVIVEAVSRVPLPTIDVATIAPIGASFWKKLDGSIDLGYSYTRSSQVSQLNINTDTVYRRPAFEARIDGSATITANGDSGERDDRGMVQASYVRYRGQRLFIASGLGFESNESLGLLLRSQLTVTAGARIINNNRAQLAIGGGLAANDERSVDIDPTQNLEGLFTFRQSYCPVRSAENEPRHRLSVLRQPEQLGPPACTTGRQRQARASEGFLSCDQYVRHLRQPSPQPRCGEERRRRLLFHRLELLGSRLAVARVRPCEEKCPFPRVAGQRGRRLEF